MRKIFASMTAVSMAAAVMLILHGGGLSGNGHGRAAVCGNALVDGQDVGAGGGKHAQNAGKRAGHILQQGVKRNDMLRLHIVEGLHRVLVLIEGAAADAGHFCDGCCWQ